MSHCIFANQPGLQLTANIQPVPHMKELNLRIFQSFPTAENPRQQVIFNATLPAEDLHLFGRFLLDATKS